MALDAAGGTLKVRPQFQSRCLRVSKSPDLKALPYSEELLLQ